MHDLIKDFAPSYHARTCLINLYIHACIHIKYQTSESSCASCHQKPSPFLENILHQSPHSCSHTYKTLYVRFVMCILSDAPNELNDLQTCSSMKHKQMCTQALTSNHLVHTLSIIFFSLWTAAYISDSFSGSNKMDEVKRNGTSAWLFG